MSIQAVAWVLEHSQSRGTARLVLISLANHHNGGSGQCNPGQRLVAEEAKVSKTGAQLALKRLVELGELEILEPGDNRRPARYRLPFVICGRSETAEKTAAVSPGLASAVTPGVTRTVRNRNEPEADAAEVDSGQVYPYPESSAPMPDALKSRARRKLKAVDEPRLRADLA